MSKKRAFQILDEMNVHDDEHGTRYVAACFDMVGAEYKAGQNGTVVSVGVPGNVVNDLYNGKKKPMLLLIDMEEYSKRE